MNLIQAQAKIKKAMELDAESVISEAILFNPSIAEIVVDTRKVNGPVIGVAAIALKHALKGDSVEATNANIITFAESL